MTSNGVITSSEPGWRVASESVSHMISESRIADIDSEFGVMMFNIWVTRVLKKTLTLIVVEKGFLLCLCEKFIGLFE